MSFETRTIAGRKYLTKTIREGSDIKKIHIGPLSNPAVALTHRRMRLLAAETQAAREAAAQEIKMDRLIDRQFQLLHAFGARLRSFRKLTTRNSNQRVPVLGITPDLNQLKRELDQLPKSRVLARLVREANAGCVNSRKLLDEIRKRSCDLVDSVTDLVALTKDSVLNTLSKDDYLLRTSFEQRVDRAIAQIKAGSLDEPLAVMTSELVAIAWLDAVRCAANAAMDHATKSDAKYWEDRSDRAQRRFSRLVNQLPKRKD